MKYALTVLALIVFNLMACTAHAEADEQSIYSIKSIERIAPVFAGMPLSGQYHEREGYYFLAFYDPDRQLTLARAKVGANDWEFVKLDETVAYDGHNDAAFNFDRQGYIHLAANMHANPLNYWRSTRPLDINSMERLDRMTGDKESDVTYPEFFHGPDGVLHFQYRSGYSGKAVQLVNIYDEETRTWRRKKMAADSDKQDEAVPLLDGSPNSSAYQSGPHLGPDGFYHLVFGWRDHFRGETNHDVGYARSKDLETWTDSQGNKIDLPITPENYERVARIPIMSGYQGKGVGFDSQNRVIVSYMCFDRDGHSQVYGARLEDGEWIHYRLTDWNKRWDMHGGGGYEYEIRYSTLSPHSEGRLKMTAQSQLLFGDNRNYQYVLDEETLRPVQAPVAVYPRELVEPPVDRPMRLFLQGPPEHMIRWFTQPTVHVENEAYAAKAPKDIWLEMIELEKNENLDPGPYVPMEDGDKSWNQMMEWLNLDASEELTEADRLYKDGDFLEAYAVFRRHWQNRIEALLADPDATPRWEDWVAQPSPRVISDYLKHRYEFDGLRRTLPYDVQTWWPFQPGVLENWFGLNHTMSTTERITAMELERISPIARWYNDLNRLKHLSGLGVAYAANPQEKTGRYWAHDFYDWFYDNPVPEQVQHVGPWNLDVAADRFCDTLMPAMYQFAESEHMRDEEYFGLVRSIAEHTRYFNQALEVADANVFEREEAAEMLHWWILVFPEFRHSKELGEKAMGLMVSYSEE